MRFSLVLPLPSGTHTWFVSGLHSATVLLLLGPWNSKMYVYVQIDEIVFLSPMRNTAERHLWIFCLLHQCYNCITMSIMRAGSSSQNTHSSQESSGHFMLCVLTALILELPQPESTSSCSAPNYFLICRTSNLFACLAAPRWTFMSMSLFKYFSNWLVLNTNVQDLVASKRVPLHAA